MQPSLPDKSEISDKLYVQIGNLLRRVVHVHISQRNRRLGTLLPKKTVCLGLSLKFKSRPQASSLSRLGTKTFKKQQVSIVFVWLGLLLILIRVVPKQSISKVYLSRHYSTIQSRPFSISSRQWQPNLRQPYYQLWLLSNNPNLNHEFYLRISP